MITNVSYQQFMSGWEEKNSLNKLHPKEGDQVSTALNLQTVWLLVFLAAFSRTPLARLTRV